MFFRVSFDTCVLRSTRAGCTLGNSKAGAAATPLPRGQTEPTKASALDLYNDTTKCLLQYQALGGTVRWGAAIEDAITTETNPSEHDSCADYYQDARLRDRMRNGPDSFIFDAFGYDTCCDGGLGEASTSEPKFRGDAEVTWPTETAETSMFCKRID